MAHEETDELEVMEGDELVASDAELDAKQFADDINSRLINTTKSQALERQWRLNIAFVAGLQYHVASRDGSLYFQRPAGSRYRAYDIRNFCRPYADRRAVAYSSFKPKFRVAPQREDPADYQSAELSELVLDHYWDKLGMDEVWHQLCYWVVVTGNGYLQVLWDDEEGEFFTEGTQNFYEGDVRVEVVPPFQIDTDPLVSRWQDVRWLRKRTRRTLSWCRQKYPKTGWNVKPLSGEYLQPYRIEDDLLGIVGPSGYHAGEDTKGRFAGCIVDEYWVCACPEFPSGRLLVMSGDVVLSDGPNPTPGGKLPFIFFYDQMVPGRLHGQSILDCMIPSQRNYNRVVSRQNENITLFGNLKVLSPQAGGLLEGGFVTDAGEILEYGGITPPQFLVPPSMPSDLDNYLMRAQADLDQTTSEFAVARGQVQGRLSGRAIDLLVEQHMKQQIPTLQRFGRGLEQWARLLLTLVQARADDQRTIRIVGQKKFTIKLWKGADLKGGSDVSIVAESYMPKSRTLALSVLQALASGGFLSGQNPEDRALALELVQLNREDELLAAKTVHTKAARLENSLLARGLYIRPAETFENHDIHVERHMEWMNSEEFRAMTPQEQSPTREHYQSHLDLAKPIVGVTLPPEMTMAEGPPGLPMSRGPWPQPQAAPQPEFAE